MNDVTYETVWIETLRDWTSSSIDGECWTYPEGKYEARIGDANGSVGLYHRVFPKVDGEFKIYSLLLRPSEYKYLTPLELLAEAAE